MSGDRPSEQDPMPAQERQPEPLEEATRSAAAASHRPIFAIVAGLLVAAALPLLQLPPLRSTPPSLPSEMTQELATRYAAAFVLAHSRLMPVDLSTEHTTNAAVQLIPAPEPVARQLVADALAGKRGLGKLTIWDNVVEDGDIV